MSVMEYNNYGAYNAYQAYPSYTGYTSQPNHFNLKVGTNSARGAESNQEIVEFLAELIRSWWGIIKSLLSSLEWIFGYWSPLPSLPSLSPLQDEYREKFTNLTKFGSKRANFGLVPSTQQPKRAEHTGRSGAATQLGKVSIPSVQCLQSWQKSSGIFVSWNKGRLCESWQSYGGSEKQTEIVTLSTAGHILQPGPCVGDKGQKWRHLPSRALEVEKYAADGLVVELSHQEQYSWHCLKYLFL